jgi:hypothetical protein
MSEIFDTLRRLYPNAYEVQDDGTEQILHSEPLLEIRAARASDGTERIFYGDPGSPLKDNLQLLKKYFSSRNVKDLTKNRYKLLEKSKEPGDHVERLEHKADELTWDLIIRFSKWKEHFIISGPDRYKERSITGLSDKELSGAEAELKTIRSMINDLLETTKKLTSLPKVEETKVQLSPPFTTKALASKDNNSKDKILGILPKKKKSKYDSPLRDLKREHPEWGVNRFARELGKDRTFSKKKNREDREAIIQSSVSKRFKKHSLQ